MAYVAVENGALPLRYVNLTMGIQLVYELINVSKHIQNSSMYS